ncbi:SGF29 [Lepeophtheirus salmonis]|uniref:SGF29 n=1 Tax=Lepeophtheirus salmonis TaxID=72036 RepID=A0A7R8HD17_LEPSM|nr:SGF29 [Lepeophtheirus salmonis]CAF3025692.1 SGF29 [Lepeophtheirus salmonis]
MSLSSDPQAAANVQQCLKDLYKLVQNVDEVKKNDETVLSAISSTHRKIESDEKLTAGNRSKLQSLYENGISDAEKEEDLLRQALRNKETIRRGALMKMLAISAETIPLWVGREGEEAPPLCGAIPPESNYTANPGDMAAALVRSPDGDENWILAEVVSFNSSTGKYEVDDIDEEQKDRHSLSRRKVIPLPTQRASPETNPEALYPPGTTVMAIYPQTTCFYKGVIKEQPSGGAEDYHVLFEDPSYADGYSPPLNVAQRYIIQVPEKKKGK